MRTASHDESELKSPTNNNATFSNGDIKAAWAPSPQGCKTPFDKHSPMSLSTANCINNISEVRNNEISRVSAIDEAQTSTPDSKELGIGSNLSLVNELQRVQGLLGAVLEKKNNRRISILPTPTKPSRPHKFENQTEEIDSLKATVKKLETERRLRKADAQFLEQSLADKDKMLSEVATVLDAVEKHQAELEKENNELADALNRSQQILSATRNELLQFKGVSEQEEMY